jgi:hypothetical protein
MDTITSLFADVKRNWWVSRVFKSDLGNRLTRASPAASVNAQFLESVKSRIGISTEVGLISSFFADVVFCLWATVCSYAGLPRSDAKSARLKGDLGLDTRAELALLHNAVSEIFEMTVFLRPGVLIDTP